VSRKYLTSLITSGAAVVLTLALAAPSFAQTQPPTSGRPMSSQPPTATGSGATDRGQQNQPAVARPTTPANPDQPRVTTPSDPDQPTTPNPPNPSSQTNPPSQTNPSQANPPALGTNPPAPQTAPSDPQPPSPTPAPAPMTASPSPQQTRPSAVDPAPTGTSGQAGAAAGSPRSGTRSGNLPNTASPLPLMLLGALSSFAGAGFVRRIR